jgi:hypothetical protein
MTDISDIFDENKIKKQVPNMRPAKSPSELEKDEADKRNREVKEQLHEIFKTEQRQTVPDKKEFKSLITEYYNTIFPENYSKYTLHTYLGFTEENIETYILPDDELKEIYEFAIEKLKAKAEISMQIAGRSTDSFAMQNLAKWRKKDPEEREESSGLAELHKSMDEYEKNNPDI